MIQVSRYEPKAFMYVYDVTSLAFPSFFLVILNFISLPLVMLTLLLYRVDEGAARWPEQAT
jgi:hypothetical protein